MALSGADATPITVHAMIDTTPTPQPAVTGTVSRECVDRVRAAIRNSGFAWPGGITVHASATLADVDTWLDQDATATSDARPPAVVEPMPTSDASPHSDGTGAVAAMLRDTEIRDALVVAAAGGHPILITTRSRSS